MSDSILLPVRVTPEEMDKLCTFLYWKHVTGNFNPTIDPTDAIAARVALVWSIVKKELDEQAKGQTENAAAR